MTPAPRTQPTRPTPAPDDVVLREFVYQVASGGKRGAYRRTGERTGRSDEYVRLLVKRQSPEPEPEVSTEYIPCPGELAYRAQLATLPPPVANETAPEPPTNANEITSTPRSSPLPTGVPMAITERATVQIVHVPVAIVYGGSRVDPNDDALPFLMALAALGVTLSVMLTALVSLVLALIWLPLPLVLWWAVARLRVGVVRRCRGELIE